jgi:ribonuclease J
MSFDLKTHKNNLLFIPFGGLNEIGMNVSLYHYHGKFIIVDCGSGFAEEYLPGVDMVVPDLSFVIEHRKDLLGIILTHAHEDHLGGIQYLWPELLCPIYTTEFTANFLRIKLAEFDFGKDVEIHKLKPGDRFNLGPFDIEMAPLTHSAPEMQALMIRTEMGNILHTGDWKFDPDPIIGNPSDEDLLKSYGDEGILALMCDSTNVLSPGHSGSEGHLRDNLVKIIANCSKLVVVTTFASNLARLDTLIHAAKSTDRKIILTGKSLHRMTQAAQDSGYLEDAVFISDKEFKNHPREKLMIIATGCQGEPLAAVNKMATGAHPCINLTQGDTIIFSSKIIPGNEKRIFRLFNIFVQQKIEVITEKDHFIHVSGHPCVDELKKMYELTRPNVAIPVHGEPVHIHEHAKLAKRLGIKHSLEARNGSVINLSYNESHIINKVKSGYLTVDGTCLIPDNSDIFKFRRKMRDDGIAIISLVFDKHWELLTTPFLNFPGILSEVTDQEMIRSLKKNLAKNINSLTQGQRPTKDAIEKSVKLFIKKFLKKEIGKNPVILLNIENARS